MTDRTPAYLLKASESEIEGWRAAASREDLTLAAFLREAANERAGIRVSPDMPGYLKPRARRREP